MAPVGGPGQNVASPGFTACSRLLDNRVFVVTNAAILPTALLGQWVHRRNVRLEESGRA